MKKIYYGKAVYNFKEINAVSNVLKNQPLSLMDGENVKNLEKKVASLFGKKYGLMVNSGSSANLLGLASLNLKKNSEIITPTLTFSTTVAPIYQLGFKPFFIDVAANKFVANIDQIKKAINKNTKAIIIPNLLGNIPEWDKIYKLSKRYNLITIEDSADTIGYKINGKIIGKYSDIVTTSFYASHIVTGAGFGGMVCFNNENEYQRAKLLRGWGRSSANFAESEKIKDRFNVKIDGIKYDGKYIFLDMGYNFLPSEISAAFALEQIKKLTSNISIRIKNFLKLKNIFSKHKDFFILPEQDPMIKTAWLAFPLIIKKNIFFHRTDMQIFFEKNNIQTRTIFTGNILRQPVMKKRIFKKVKNCSIESDKVMERGILLGCHHDMGSFEISSIEKCLKKFLKFYKAI